MCIDLLVVVEQASFLAEGLEFGGVREAILKLSKCRPVIELERLLETQGAIRRK